MSLIGEFVTVRISSSGRFSVEGDLVDSLVKDAKV